MKIIETLTHNAELDARGGMYPSRLVAGVGRPLRLSDELSTKYGYIVAGEWEIRTAGFRAVMREGAFFALPGNVVLVPAPDGVTSIIELADDFRDRFQVVVFERFGYRGLPTLGLTEARGRLSYIDGCSDTLLAPPPRLGDPCLNFLHFPRGIVQTQHTHPSIRLGVVARGGGKAFRRAAEGNPENWELPLTPGCAFLLDEQELHSFRTDESETGMDIIAFHPDSDWGPTDTAHPMLNRTYIDHGKR